MGFEPMAPSAALRAGLCLEADALPVSYARPYGAILDSGRITWSNALYPL